MKRPRPHVTGCDCKHCGAGVPSVCHARHCDAWAAPANALCRAHLAALPAELRSAVLSTFRQGQKPNRERRRTLAAAVEAAALADAATCVVHHTTTQTDLFETA